MPGLEKTPRLITLGAKLPKYERKKLDSKSRKCVTFCSSTITHTTKGYRFYDPLKKKVVFSQDVIFYEKNVVLKI